MELTPNSLWPIPALPLLAAAVSALTPRRGRVFSATVAIAALAGSLVLSILALATALKAGSNPLFSNFTWFGDGAETVRIGWLLDPLAAFMLVMVSAVGLLIFIFSLGYMAEDPNFTRFFCFLSLFAAAMLGLVISNSLLLLFGCWELVGLASYLLIGFWFEKPAAAAAAKKAFITTRLGDLGLLLGMLWLYNAHGSLLFYDGGSGCLEPAGLAALSGRTLACGLAVSTAIGLLIFAGAIGKSGQFPLHVWLPDAMEGPTPVSALIHAATMVAAGVFLIARLYPLMSADLGSTSTPVHALTVVATIGSITALLGALLAVAQNDLKRVLAYSTVSQLGYMMLALGVGSWVAAIFHLLAHACFKALLFLGAGSVIHAAHHEQDMRRLGGLGSRMRATFATFGIAAMALAGVPFLFSGFWSKEGILHAASLWSVSSLPLAAGLAGAALTAFYMTRLVGETFLGSGPRDPHLAEHPPHESPRIMTVPLVLLAVPAFGFGFLGTPAWPWLQARLAGVAPAADFGKLFEGGGLMLGSIALVAAGIAAGWVLYVAKPRRDAAAADPLSAFMPRIFRALAARLGFDEAYAATVCRLYGGLAIAAAALDRAVIDGLVAAIARLGQLVGFAGRGVDEKGLNAGFDGAGGGLRAGGRGYSRSQSGDARGYLGVLAAGFVVLALVAIWAFSR